MVSPIELRLELQTAIIIISKDPWEIDSFNAIAHQWLGDRLKVGVRLSEVLEGVNELALRRRLSKGRDARFDRDFEIGFGRTVPVEFICTQTDTINSTVILEGTEQSRAKSAELMLASYSRMIEDKTKELEAAIQARDQFFSTMSHELRTPLNSILGFSESLIDEIYGEVNPEQNRILKKIYTNGQNLMSLLASLLHLSRIRSGKLDLNLKRLDLKKACRRALIRFEDNLKDKSMTVITHFVDVEQPLVDLLWADQLIDHLISNAIKFSDEHSTIGVSLSPWENYIRVTIWDQGIGIPSTYLKKIFQPFTQVDSSLSRGYNGSGLGLSVVSEVMELHGGSVSVESELHQGSRFHLDFKL